MTPTKQSPEQRAREFVNGLPLKLNHRTWPSGLHSEDCDGCHNKRVLIKELTTLITKADALDWLSDNFYLSAIQEPDQHPKGYSSWVFHIPSNQDGYTDLLSAITEAMKGRE